MRDKVDFLPEVPAQRASKGAEFARMLTYASLTGPAVASVLDDVARLRIGVFRDFPYLDDGTLDYERDYLARFAASDGAVVVVARDGARVVGAATGCPLAAEHDEFKAPFSARGLDVNSIFYCAESVLLPDYRGQGAGAPLLRPARGAGSQAWRTQVHLLRRSAASGSSGAARGLCPAGRLLAQTWLCAC